MGIPGLASRLEPYAARYTSTDLDGYAAIIDGPALAYFAHRIASEGKKSQLASYADITATAIRWLAHLEAAKIKVSAVLFDGALPTTKREERSARLLQSVRRVTQLNVMNSGASCPVPTQLGSVVYPLLAPALMEALRTSSFAKVTRMVPGEADEWCALHARENPRSIIFTSDTDLLLYDYPADVLVNFLKDEDVSPAALKLYSPSKICQQLGIQSLVQLAYAVHNDRWKSLTEIAKEARHQSQASPPDTAHYDAFNKRYTASVITPTYLSLDSELDVPLQSLDARVSEFVLQSLAITRGNLSTEEHPLAISMFLPLFMEDPFQSSAWKHSQAIRRLGYSLLAPRRVVIQEHIRKAQGVGVQEFELASVERMSTAAEELCSLLSGSHGRREALGEKEKQKDTFKEQKNNEKEKETQKNGEDNRTRWTLLATRLALQTSTFKPPHISLSTRVLTGAFDGTWSFIHLQACVQATLYSLRIMKQCITVWLALLPASSNGSNISASNDETQGPGRELEPVIRRLHRELERIPGIAELFLVPGQEVTPLREAGEEVGELDTMLRSIYAAAGVDDEELFREAQSKRQKKREKREKRGKGVKKVQTDPPSARTAEQLGSNVFALLEQGR